jgi:hypothetical protein
MPGCFKAQSMCVLPISPAPITPMGTLFMVALVMGSARAVM